MFDEVLRAWKERLLRPFALASVGVSPNTITLVSGACGVVCAACCWNNSPVFALFWWVLNRILDGLDGTVARITKRQTDFGGHLDILVDFSVYALVPLALAACASFSAPTSGAAVSLLLSVGFLEGTYFVNAASLFQLSAILEKRRFAQKAFTSVAMPKGIIEGAETVVAYSAFIVTPLCEPLNLAFVLTIEFSIFATLVALTSVLRTVWAYRILANHGTANSEDYLNKENRRSQ
ncbi:MAG: hypothetical protein MHM6MM_005760 [Cercozoa sp. M6MM]